MIENKSVKNKALKIVFLCMLVLWMALIFYMSAKDAGESSEMSSPLAIWTAKTIVPGYADMTAEQQEKVVSTVEVIIRKGGHFTEYAILGALMYIVINMYAVKKKSFILSLLLSALYAASDEIHQYFVPGRACMFGDVLIDSSGALVGIIACILILNSIFCIKKNKDR